MGTLFDFVCSLVMLLIYAAALVVIALFGLSFLFTALFCGYVLVYWLFEFLVNVWRVRG